MAKLFGSRAEVRLNGELFRIRDIPRRVWTEEQAEALVEKLTPLLSTDKGTMRLRPTQAIALHEIGTYGGMLGPLRVGAGKTLISLLAPTVTFARRPLLMVPAALIDKTKRDISVLEYHWDIEPIRIMSYELLGRAQAAEALEKYQPDLIVADEAHKLKNLRAAVTRRATRYFLQYPETLFVAMSGTVTKRSLFDYSHLAKWALPIKHLPLPVSYTDLELWAGALDERKREWERTDPEAFQVLCDDEELRLWKTDKRGAARRAYRRRLVETPGVVATKESPIDATLVVQAAEPKMHRDVDAAFERLRDEWETPDGWPIADALTMFRHARELALGFYYIWNPRPPDHWLEARRRWASFVRQVLKHSRKLDSELQVRNQHGDSAEWKAWAKVKDDFTPNTEAVWLDETALEFCASWAKKHTGIVWTEHQVFGDRLAKDYGLAYYGKKGLNDKKMPIETHPKGQSMVASIASNAEGRNLQAWNKNLVVSPPPDGRRWEQLIGRTHRDGQEADEVVFDVLVTCAEHVGAIGQAVRDCEYVEASTGSPQKLLLADITVPTASQIAVRKGPRWRKE